MKTNSSSTIIEIGTLIKYTNNSKNEVDSISKLIYTTGLFGETIIHPITTIENEAIDDTSLRTLIIPTCIKEIKENAFINSKNLKTLIIESTLLDKIFRLNYVENIYSNIENIIFKGNIIIPDSKMPLFSNLKNIYITKSTILENINIFPKNTNIYYNNKIITLLNDETTKIKENNQQTIITNDYIKALFQNHEYALNNPIKVIEHLNILKQYNLNNDSLKNGILVSLLEDGNKHKLFSKLNDDNILLLEKTDILKNYDSYTKHLLNNPDDLLNKLTLLDEHSITDNILYNKLVLSCLSYTTLKLLLELDKNKLITSLNKSNILNILTEENNPYGRSDVILINSLFLEKSLLFILNHSTNSFLYNYIIMCNTNNLKEKLIENFDNNLKRLINTSKILIEGNDKNKMENMNSLLNLMEITGALENDIKIRQSASTFITEKIFLSNNKLSTIDIHNRFNFIKTNVTYNKEFAIFFKENYAKLNILETTYPNITQKIYANFNYISTRTSSNKGTQRKLKVTLENALNFLNEDKFENITEDNKNIARKIGWWFDNQDTFNKALNILDESKKAPRNIFTKTKVINNIITHTDDIEDDIREINPSLQFTYEWLPKQSVDNLLLGKYCDCCSHVEGFGTGVMRASMILDCCQNLVIRNSNSEIISKATIYVNKENNYAVFNKVETNINYKNDLYMPIITDAFIRGTNKFVEVFNENNPDNKIQIVTIGNLKSCIIKYLDESRYPTTDELPALYYSNYSCNKFNNEVVEWQGAQKTIVKL